MLDELGLNKCADTIVGGALIKGISGGERKRTSVGVELVVKPALIFLDEPSKSLCYCILNHASVVLHVDTHIHFHPTAILSFFL
jgi:ABC-type glutathione transport system ATPase component